MSSKSVLLMVTLTYLVSEYVGCDEAEGEPSATRPRELSVDAIEGGHLDHPPQGGVGHAQTSQQALVYVYQVLKR